MTVYQFVCVLLSLFGFEGGMWDLIVLVPDHCLSFDFSIFRNTFWPISVTALVKHAFAKLAPRL